MARVDVLMPQMGESIAEGTLSKWLKKVGDPVKRDEPLFEISTDKVDAEIPAPTAGARACSRAEERRWGRRSPDGRAASAHEIDAPRPQNRGRAQRGHLADRG